MKHLRSSLTAATLSFALVASGNAQTTATTDPVGFVSYLVKANSDQKVGIPMARASVFEAAASTVSGVTVSASSIPALAGRNYLLVTSGSAVGQWEEIASSTSSNVTMQASISGFAAGNTFLIRPFWTLSTLFPNGGSIPVSQDPENPNALVLVNDPLAVGENPASGGSFLYHDGSSGVLSAGWYANGSFESANDFVLSPESFIMMRNSTSSAFTASFVGSAPMDTTAIAVVRRAAGGQDNLILNQFPSDVTLAASGLAASGAVASSPDPENPTDVLFVYDLNNTGFNPASSASYLYHAGGVLPAGWYANGSFESADTVTLPPGGAIVIRKASGANEVIQFTPTVPYSLN